ncbi:hypothetical protein MIND_00021500 [Mycena indigotica]|uniref:Uncharacterized protein n=1 Tax=Mycena indigotica TaxID=2126181 RepID=A0A8H6TAS4_9AGAR|nr:uncharacterized protein MIND_00021500 [Mycena indigotica]KAF7315073.1 hypothetical protein MIND_00021500 [Mycena indigotica]
MAALLVVLGSTMARAKKILSAVQHGATLYQNEEVVVVFALIEGEVPDLEVIGRTIGEEEGGLDIRLYHPLESDPQIRIPLASTDQHILVFNGMTPDEGMEEEFNAWYADEHIAMLQQVPGWRSSIRFKLLHALGDPQTGGVTKYLALHEWATRDAFSTKEFQAATNTPWRTRVVIGGVHQKERLVLEFQGEAKLM